MIRYFKENGWPSSTLFDTPPESDEDRAKLIDTLQVCSLIIVTFMEYLQGASKMRNWLSN